MTRLDILREAREIAYAQGAVLDGVHYWEEPATGEERAEGTWGCGELEDPGACRVCAAGAVMLAELRAGLVPNQKKTYPEVEVAANKVHGPGWVRAMAGNTEALVAIIDEMIEREMAPKLSESAPEAVGV